MGKPFDKELVRVPQTLRWAFSLPLDPSIRQMINHLASFPLLAVGSGGSLSAAHFIARVHEQVTGSVGKAMTPLELLFSSVCPARHSVLLLSASGNNRDIINAFEKAVKREYAAVGIICASVNSKIAQIAQAYPHIHIFQYHCPSGKDGFLAVNSLLSTVILAGRAYDAIDLARHDLRELVNIGQSLNIEKNMKALDRKTIVAIGGDWGWPALIDLESKFSEAGLANVLLSDLRNFAHGRHNWFNRRGDESSLLLLETPQLAKLANRTLELLPIGYPRVVLRTSFSGPLAAIDLHIKVFHFVNQVGQRWGIDPGKPNVPKFGRRIYHLGLSSAYRASKSKNRDAWIDRKARASDNSRAILSKSLDEFLETLGTTIFAGIVFDYDGTLCDLSQRNRNELIDKWPE